MNMDYFFDDQNCINRLLHEYEKYGSLIVAFDYDNTVFDYYGKGHTFSEMIELLRECKKLKFHLVVFTSCNDDRIPEIKKYLAENNIPYDAINETPEWIPFKGRKIYYNHLLDDRAGLGSAYRILSSVVYTIKGRQANAFLTEPKAQSKEDDAELLEFCDEMADYISQSREFGEFHSRSKKYTIQYLEHLGEKGEPFSATNEGTRGEDGYLRTPLRVSHKSGIVECSEKITYYPTLFIKFLLLWGAVRLKHDNDKQADVEAMEILLSGGEVISNDDWYEFTMAFLSLLHHYDSPLNMERKIQAVELVYRQRNGNNNGI